VSSRLQALRELDESSLDDFDEGVVVLLDRIPIGNYQNDSPRRPKRTHPSEMSVMTTPRAGETIQCHKDQTLKENQREVALSVPVRATE
jgi:hypothetical protein